MFIFWSGTDLPQPPATAAGQRDLIEIIGDYQSFQTIRSNLTAGFGITVVDETNVTGNQTLAADVQNVKNISDNAGVHKYYAKSDGTIWERFGWVRGGQSTLDVTKDINHTFPQSAERNNFETNLQAVITNLTNLATQTATTIGQLNSDKQELARDVRFLMRMIARLLVPDRTDI